MPLTVRAAALAEAHPRRSPRPPRFCIVFNDRSLKPKEKWVTQLRFCDFRGRARMGPGHNGQARRGPRKEEEACPA